MDDEQHQAPRGPVLGARIEFYEHVGPPPGREATGFIGAAVCDELLLGAAVPRAGDQVAIASLDGGGLELSPRLRPWGSGPFLPVVRVEHYPVALPDQNGRAPRWWQTSWETPSATLVFNAEAAPDGGALGAALSERGWQLDPNLLTYTRPATP